MASKPFVKCSGDIWDYADTRHTLVIPVNLLGVFGRGLAAQAAHKYPEAVSYFQAHKNTYSGQWCTGLLHGRFANTWICYFPVKYFWRSKASLDLITASAHGLVKSIQGSPDVSEWVIPQIGCGHGELDWEDVSKVILPILEPVKFAIRFVFPKPILKKKYPYAFRPGARKDKL